MIEQAIYPDWIPDSVQASAEYWARHWPDGSKKREALGRLITDPRMKHVWGELTKRHRQNGRLFHRVRPEEFANCGPEEAHGEALARLVHLVARAAGDEVATSSLPEVREGRENKRLELQTFQEVAEIHVNVASAKSVAAFMALLEEELRDARDDADPLVIERDRKSDRVASGVQIVIAAHMEEVFGKRLDGLSAVLAAVALGKPKLNPRVSRSALTRRPLRR